jgi:hypothetical protein
MSRQIAPLRAHRLVRKAPWTHRYHLSVHRRVIVMTLICVRNASMKASTKLAAYRHIRKWKEIGGQAAAWGREPLVERGDRLPPTFTTQCKVNHSYVMPDVMPRTRALK